MRSDVAQDLTDSAADFLRVVWPSIQSCFGGGEIVPVEAVDNTNMAKDLDMLAGIDAWHMRRDDGLMRGVASRVQWKEWRSFTTRLSRSSGAKTEYEKRLAAIFGIDGYLYPELTVQAYVSERGGEGVLTSCAIIRTRHLFEFMEEGLAERRTNHADGNEFLVCFWDRKLPSAKGAETTLCEWCDRHNYKFAIVEGEHGE